MSTVEQSPEIREEPARSETDRATTDRATVAALNEIRRDVHEQSRSIRRTQQAFTIFAAMALLLAMASLLAVALKPGLTKSVSLKLAAGHYALICNLPGHYLAGQHTDFTVG